MDGAITEEVDAMLYGYARVSTQNQQIDRQVRNFERYAGELHMKIYKEFYTGTRANRPEWRKLLARVDSGDTIVFDEVSRMSRNAEEGFAAYKELYEKGVELVFLKEPHINTASYRSAMSVALPEVKVDDTAAKELLKGILEAIKAFVLAKVEQDIREAFERAQAEVDYLHQRTKEGMEVAREKGKQIGLPAGTKLTTRKSVGAKDVIRKHSRTFGGTLSDKECQKLAGVSRNSYFKYKRELLEEVSAV